MHCGLDHLLAARSPAERQPTRRCQRYQEVLDFENGGVLLQCIGNSPAARPASHGAALLAAAQLPGVSRLAEVCQAKFVGGEALPAVWAGMLLMDRDVVDLLIKVKLCV
jgi:hypothetical protein